MRSHMAALDRHICSNNTPGDNCIFTNSAWSITHPTLTYSFESGINQNHLLPSRTITVSPPASPSVTRTPLK
jgi:hypothetical protein